MTSPGEGHLIAAYDMDRTICDIVHKRSEMDIAAFNYAVKEYMKRKGKNLSRLMAYTSKMLIRNYARGG